MIGGLNPYMTMWAHPRNTIRAIITAKPKYGVFLLATVYALQSFFYFANYWSFGLSYTFYTILAVGAAFCPLIGLVWLYLTGWVLYFTGRIMGGRAPQLYLRTASAWSKIPSSAGLFMWFLLLVAHPEYVFIQNAGGPTALFISFITVILSIWSMVLLIQSVREVQGFSLLRSLINVVFAWLFFSVLLFFFFMVSRFVYISVLS